MKKKIYIILFLAIFAFVMISLYTTFAYNEEVARLDNSTANYNLIYSLKESGDRQVSIASKNETFVDITLTNTYGSSVKYGIYYHLVNLDKVPDGLQISLANNSLNKLQDIINPNDTYIVSLKIVNNSNYNVDLIVGALVGFENGNIDDLVTADTILVK